MNLKWYKSVILPLVICYEPLNALAKIAQAKQRCKPKNDPIIFPPARLLVDGRQATGGMGIYCLFRWR